MNISEFFIERPIFAAVVSTFITIAGALALVKLPVGEYPEVVPPSIVVTANYPGANPKVIADTVAAPLEQAIVGVDDMLYMSSTSTMNGTLSLTVTFKLGADVDRAQVQVQNRVAQAQPCRARFVGASTSTLQEMTKVPKKPAMMWVEWLMVSGLPPRSGQRAWLHRQAGRS